jgi:ATP-binding cassette subfamily B protein
MARSRKIKENLPSLWRITHYFLPYARQHRGLMAASLAALFAEIGLRLLEPWPLKIVFDHVLGQAGRGRLIFLKRLESLDPITLLGLAALAVVTITGLRALASYVETVGFAQIGNRVLRKVRAQLYRHVQYLSPLFHTRSKTGDLVVRVISDVGMLQDVIVSALLPLVARGLVIVGMIILMFTMNWRLALIALAVFPLFWMRSFQLGHRIREIAQKQRRQEGAMAATAAESISAIKTVQALSLEETFAATFASDSERSLKEDVKGKRLAASLERSVDVMVALATALVLWFGTRMVLSAAITAGDLLVFLAYLKSAYRPVQDFAKYTTRLAKAAAAGERVIDLLERVPDVRDAPGAVRAPALTGHVRFEGVTFGYDPDRPALENIDLDVPAATRVAIVGPSGSGKSTLVSLVLRL